jgi:proline iminopeptidase
MRIPRRPTLLSLVLLIFAVLAAAWLWHAASQPLYRPGMLHDAAYLSAPLELPSQPANSERWLVEPGIELHHWSVGQGEPILVLHGGPGFPLHTMPEGFESLTDRYEIHFYDQRGCGRSTRPFDRFEGGNFYSNMVKLEKTLGIGAQLADIERIRRILEHEQLILVGHSFGAFLAAMYAAEFPDRVRALVLVAPAGVLTVPDKNADFFEMIRGRLPAAKQPEFDAFMTGYLDFGKLFERSEAELASMNRQLGDFFIAASKNVGLPVSAPPIWNNGGWMVQAVYLSMGKRHDYAHALARVKAPTLVIHGEDDILPQRIARQYADSITGAKLVVLKSARTRAAAIAGHFPFASDPVAFARVLTDFLE